LLRRILIVAVNLAALAACGTEVRETGTSANFDDSGRPVDLSRPVTRIVSLAPALTETLFALGVGDKVVGRTRWCDAPPEALGVTSVGDGLEPNVEVILSQRPDLFVFYSAVANEPAIAQIESLGINTLSVRTDRLLDLVRATMLLGLVTGTVERADSLVSSFERSLAALEESRPEGPVLNVLILTWDNPPIIIGASSFLNEIVELAGARNVFDDVEQPSLRVSIEAIVERDPDLVLVTSDSSLTNRVDRPEWRVVPAIRDRRFFLVMGNEYSRPSFRAPNGIRRLRAALEDWR
jgi:iron complex transport system substrate-binding protein